MPTRKVGVGLLAGSLVLIGAWAAREFAKVELPADVQGAMQLVITFIASYATPDAET